MSEKMRYNFKYGDIIEFKGKEYVFGELHGEDYVLQDDKGQDTKVIREYYIKKFKKIGERTITKTVPVYKWD